MLLFKETPRASPSIFLCRCPPHLLSLDLLRSPPLPPVSCHPDISADQIPITIYNLARPSLQISLSAVPLALCPLISSPNHSLLCFPPRSLALPRLSPPLFFPTQPRHPLSSLHLSRSPSLFPISSRLPPSLHPTGVGIECASAHGAGGVPNYKEEEGGGLERGGGQINPCTMARGKRATSLLYPHLQPCPPPAQPPSLPSSSRSYPPLSTPSIHTHLYPTVPHLSLSLMLASSRPSSPPDAIIQVR